MARPLDIDYYLDAWEKREKGNGYIVFNPEDGTLHFVESELLETTESRAKRARENLPDAERQIANQLPHMIQILARIEPRLKGQWWNTLKQSHPLLYAHIVFGIFSSSNNLQAIEKIEEEFDLPPVIVPLLEFHFA